MSEPRFLYFQSIVQFRIPVNDDGKVGTPEILKRWTSPYNDTVKKKVRKELIPEKNEEEYI